jgi:hypothetical protein
MTSKQEQIDRQYAQALEQVQSEIGHLEEEEFWVAIRRLEQETQLRLSAIHAIIEATE